MSAGAVAASYVATTTSSFAATMASLSPAVWYRQGESSGTTMVDSSGNARHGSYSGGVPTFGQPGLLHDGSTDTSNLYSTSTVTFGSVAATGWTSGTTLSVFARCKPAALSGTQAVFNRFSGGSGGSSDSWSLRIDGTAAIVWIRDAGSTYRSLTLGTVAAGVEYSLGFSFGGGEIRGFFDGAYVGSLSVATINSSASTFIGRSFYGEAFGGNLDEIAYWTTKLADADQLALHVAAA